MTRYGNNPDPSYLAADNTIGKAEQYGTNRNPVHSATTLAKDGAGDLTQFHPGCEEIYGVIANALHNLESHGVSVGEATGNAAADGASTDQDVASEYAALPSIHAPHPNE